MRWFKHMSLAHADKAVAFILETYGAEGYGIWWLLMEDIAAPMEPGKMDPTACHSAVKWSQICYCSMRRFMSITKSFADQGLISIQSIDGRIEIAVPNILKYKDEYSKKSGQHPEQEQRESRNRVRAETTSSSSPDDGFELKPPPEKTLTQAERIKLWFDKDFWPLYMPLRNAAKQEALKAALSVLPGKVPQEIIKGLRAQIPMFEAMVAAGDKKSIPHAATWLRGHRWQDEPEVPRRPVLAVVSERRNQTSFATEMLK